jgi:TonB family protein
MSGCHSSGRASAEDARAAPALREEHAMQSSALRIEEPPELPTPCEPEPALEVRAVFNGFLIGTRLLPESGGRRRPQLGPKANYVIGESPSADAPAPSEILGAKDLPLVSRWTGGFLVTVTPKMTGDVAVGGKVYQLADYLAGRGSSFTLPTDARARINCGAMSFRLDHTADVKPMPRRRFAWSWREQRFTLASVLAIALVLTLGFAVPPDGATASGDLLGMGRHFVPFTITAPEPEKAPEVANAKPDRTPGDEGKAHAGPSGKMGDPDSKQPTGRYAVAGNGIDMHLGKAQAVAAARNAGILGILNRATASPFASIFGRDSAVGDAAETVLGNLIGNEVANGYGLGGLGPTGSGAGGGGMGLATIGIGRFNTLGHDGYGRGPGIGGLGTRHVTKAPSFTLGVANVRGSLDKEIIRRVVRLHLNEVRYCYDQELVKKAAIEGRVAVQFVISPQGQVMSSVLQSTTMGNVRVEKCVVDAVKRWEFPKPAKGGIVIVSYPFNFVAGAGG